MLSPFNTTSMVHVYHGRIINNTPMMYTRFGDTNILCILMIHNDEMEWLQLRQWCFKKWPYWKKKKKKKQVEYYWCFILVLVKASPSSKVLKKQMHFHSQNKYFTTITSTWRNSQWQLISSILRFILMMMLNFTL